jgi:hypothetical protein
MTPQEAHKIADQQAARRAALAKFPDGAAVITDEDIKHLSGGEINALANAGRLAHMGIGPDKRLRRGAA